MPLPMPMSMPMPVPTAFLRKFLLQLFVFCPHCNCCHSLGTLGKNIVPNFVWKTKWWCLYPGSLVASSSKSVRERAMQQSKIKHPLHCAALLPWEVLLAPQPKCERESLQNKIQKRIFMITATKVWKWRSVKEWCYRTRSKKRSVISTTTKVWKWKSVKERCYKTRSDSAFT